MGLVSIGDAELYVETHGSGDDMLLIAGLGGRGAFWHKQIEHLARRFRVIVHDHRGVGKSTAATLVSGAEEMADDVLLLMDAMRIDPAHIVGHSTGGAIGQHMALKQPQRVRSLVLSASWAGPTELFIDTFRLRRDVLINSGVRQYMMMGSLLANPCWSLSKSYTGLDDFLRDKIEGFPGLDVELGRLNAVMTHDLRHRVAEISVPTGVISAHDDALTPPAMSDELAERIPEAIQVTLPEGGHFCPITVTENYNTELSELLNKLTA